MTTSPSRPRARHPIPTTLAVGAHYDCDYSAVAAAGTTTNVATGDSAETDSDTGTATVIATAAPAPALTVDKGVSLSADGPFAASLTTTVGTTVHYRITLTNTGNVALSGVTLIDDHFALATRRDPIPTTLAVGAHYDCDYSAVAPAGSLHPVDHARSSYPTPGFVTVDDIPAGTSVRRPRDQPQRGA